ncbi:MAG TPA: preprotein translocase subunit YajC [Nocardioides sp.]|nr:preprotein translocase subunit YajC [Nocardioides sp.]
MSLLPLIGIVVVFWLLVILPASRRQKATRQMQAALSAGDEVVLTSGIFGTVSELADGYVLVELAPGVEVKVARSAIGAIAPDETPDETPDEELETQPSDATDAPENDSEER